MSFDAEKVRRLAEERRKQNELLQESKLADLSAKRAEELKSKENFDSLRDQLLDTAKRGALYLGWNDEYLPIRKEDQDWLRARGFWVKPVRLRNSYRDWLNKQLIESKNKLHVFSSGLVSETRLFDDLPNVGSFSLNPLLSLSEKIWQTNPSQKDIWLKVFYAEVSVLSDRLIGGATKLLSISKELCELFFEFKRIEQKLLEITADNEFLASLSLNSGMKISWADSGVQSYNDFELSASLLHAISTHWESMVGAIEQEMQAQFDSNLESFHFDISSVFPAEVILAHNEADEAYLEVYSLPLLIEELKARGFSVALEWRRGHVEPVEYGTESEPDRIQELLRITGQQYLDSESREESFKGFQLRIRLNW